MTVTKECELCGTMLEFEQDGRRFAFTAHTPELCRAGTKQRIADLKQALLDQQQLFERKLRQCVREADRVLADAGLPTLTERSKQCEALSFAALWRAGAITLPEGI